VGAAGEQVEVARATLDYAQQTLTQSQDRFSSGVTNNIEVIQAQEALATANQQYIGSLYAHNIAKVLLARAIGAAEQTLRQVLGDDGLGSSVQVNPAAAK
jgi:outer membrane protein TolC